MNITSKLNQTIDGRRSKSAEDGFSLAEVMLSSLIFSVITAAALSLSRDTQQNLWSVQGASNLLDSGLRALTQMKHDIRLAGHPNAGCFSATAASGHPGIVANSFISASGYDLVFQGDVNGDGQVEQVEYTLPAGSQTLMRFVTPVNPDGTISAGNTVSQTLLSNVQNQLNGQPVFSWSTDPLSQNPFPQNIRVVYVNLILQSVSVGSNAPSNLALATACERMNP